MVLRIGGLASGLDIDTMVNELMKAQRTRVVQLEQDKQILQWKQENYHEVNKTFANFILNTKSSFGLTTTTSTGTLVNMTVNNLDWVKSASISDSDVASVTAYANAVQGSYLINVDRLAENWTSASQDTISIGDTGNLSTQFGLDPADTINFTITTNLGSVTVNKTNLDTVSLSTVINEINNANIGVKAIYDADVDRFFLQTTNTGEDNTIEITDSSTLTGGVKFLTGSTNVLKLKYLDATDTLQDISDGITYGGINAQIDFGAALNITKSSNTFTLNNICFTLNSTGSATVTVATNVAGVYEKITEFVEAYNEMIETVRSELTETRYSDYRPLTDEQREKLTDTQIEQWETKAKSGLLKNDMLVGNILGTVRSGMYQAVSGVTGLFDELVDIGISTETYSSGSLGGKLVIDRAKLTAAIEDNVDSVLELFFKQPSEELRTMSESSMTAEQISQKRSESGLINRLYDNLIAGMKQVVYKSGVGDNADLYRNVNSLILIEFVSQYGSISYLDNDISRLDDRIELFNERLTIIEERYWRQFTAMETAISQMNQQSAWLAMQFNQNNMSQ